MARLMFSVEERKTLRLTRDEAELIVKCLGRLLEDPCRGAPLLHVTLYGEPAFELTLTVDKELNASRNNPGSTPGEATEGPSLA